MVFKNMLPSFIGQVNKELLMTAAKNAELQDALFLVGELGDYSVTYQIAGFLEDIESMPLARSKLRSCVLDALHEAKIEIVSPAFMNQRRLPDDELVLPERTQRDSPAEDIKADKVLKEKVFDKTMEAGKTEKRRFELKKRNEEIGKLQEELKEADEQAAEAIEREIRKKERRVKAIVRVLETEADEKKE
jgi:hypothetical protein